MSVNFGQRSKSIRQQATGNRQQATGNRQQATGNRQLYTLSKNRVNYPIAYIFPLLVFQSIYFYLDKTPPVNFDSGFLYTSILRSIL